jgi:enoyl-CoA hydratase/carnithine racemase
MIDQVRYAVSGHVARLTLDRAEVRNALGIDMLRSMERHLTAASADSSVHLVLLDAEGPAFCAGMDLKSVDLTDASQAATFSEKLASVYHGLMTLPVPLLCAVDGPVSGGGVGLVAAADLVWAGPGARFQLPETRLGLVPALVSVPLRRRAGSRILDRMALGGVSLNADQAVAHGLADVRTDGDASAVARAFASEHLREHSAAALARTKGFLVAQSEMGLEKELTAAARAFQEAVATVEARRGLEAFRRKEPVRWHDE